MSFLTVTSQPQKAVHDASGFLIDIPLLSGLVYRLLALFYKSCLQSFHCFEQEVDHYHVFFVSGHLYFQVFLPCLHAISVQQVRRKDNADPSGV